jgi:hypothetical protein
MAGIIACVALIASGVLAYLYFHSQQQKTLA